MKNKIKLVAVCFSPSSRVVFVGCASYTIQLLGTDRAGFVGWSHKP